MIMSSQDHITSKKAEKGEGRSRILARQLARQLTAEEIEVVAGARRKMAGGTCSAGTYCTPDCDD
jgi:hypothetical protein